jgi:hypothetical protein
VLRGIINYQSGDIPPTTTEEENKEATKVKVSEIDVVHS